MHMYTTLIQKENQGKEAGQGGIEVINLVQSVFILVLI